MKLGIWLLCFCMHAASAQTTLGRVLEFGCDNDETENALDRFYLKRYDKHKTLQLLQPLRAKDRLVLVNHACYITFSVGDKIERVDRKMPSYLIEHAKQTSWMDRLVTALFDTPARATAGTAATKRGDVDELIMPLFVKLPREKYLIAGRHELFLTWKGGLAPYKVRIYRDDDTLLFERIEIPSADKPVRLVFSKPLFTAGKHYLLEIQSAWQCTDKVKDPGLCITEGRFKAVAAAGFPVLPDEPGSLSEHARRVRLAAWLLDWKNGQGKWILEAYQQIAGMEKEDNRLAALLMERGFQ